MSLTIPRGATVNELTRTLARHLRLEPASGRGNFVLRSNRLGHLNAERDLFDVGLRNGERLELALDDAVTDATTLSGSNTTPAIELVVTGGPAAGRRFPLSRGAHKLGRGDVCEVRLDDRSLSREHLEITVFDGEVRIRDLESRNGTAIEGDPLHCGEERVLANGQHVEAGRTLLAFLAPRDRASAATGGHGNGTVRFNRPPRIGRQDSGAIIELGAVPAMTKGFRPPLGAAMIPLVMGIAFALLLQQPAMLLFAAMAPAMAGWTFVADRRSGRAKFKRDKAAFVARLAQAREQADRARAEEATARRSGAPDPAELVACAIEQKRELWERRPGDADFLALRVGVADQGSSLTIKYAGTGAAELQGAAEELASGYSTVAAVPAIVSLREAGVLGLCGTPQKVAALGRWLALQAATLHSPRELTLVVAVAPEHAAAWEWLKWLPHTVPGETLTADCQLASTPQTARTVLRSVTELLAARQADMGDRFGIKRQDLGAAVLMTIDEALQVERSQVLAILERGPDVGIYTIWLGHEEHDLPGQCGMLANLASDVAKLSLTAAASGETLVDVTADAVDAELAEDAARALSPVQDAGGAAARSQIPRRVLLTDLLGLESISAEPLAAVWQSRSARRGVKATLGLSADGPLGVDLRADGPHALVAGITGAGKSELLQTLVASLAASYPPYRVSFLLIDYKGGAAFKDCARLPHVVGMVTDLDGHLTHRALTSLNAELRRREKILRSFDVRDLAEMERIAPDEAPANLVVIIDEFAALAREVPSFVDGVVDVAQRGRSLGVHLVLATQRPGGVVSENIRANTNLRIALRVATLEQSQDVIAGGDAARIPRSMPGRAFARTGASELTEFQSAFVGAPAVLEGKPVAVELKPFPFDRGHAPRQATHGTTVIARPLTDLGAIVAAAIDATELIGCRVPDPPWLDPLPPIVGLDALEEAAGEEQRRVGSAIVGLVDEPAAQRQWTLALDLVDEGSALIYGASGAGKTALMRTLAASLALHATPEQLHIYCLDFASRGLGGLEALPHCGSVIAGDDDERVKRLLRMLRTEIDRRKRILGDAGVLSLAEFEVRGADAVTLPRLVLLLDSYAGFTSSYDRVDASMWTELLPRIVAEGRGVGVHVIASADRRAAIPPAVAGVIPRKLVLRMAEEDEYQSLGLDLRSVRGAVMPPGRGFASGAMEFQAALLGEDPSSEAQSESLSRLGTELRARFSGRVAPPIAVLPARIRFGDLPVATRRLSSTFAVGDDRLAPVVADLDDSHLVVAGPYRSGRTSALASLVAGLIASTPGLETHLLAPRRSELANRFRWSSVAAGDEDCVAAARRLAEVVAARPGNGATPMLVVIDDGGELGDGPAAGPLEAIVRRGRDLDVHVLLGIEAGTARVAFTPWIKELRKDGHGVLLDPDQDLHGDILSIRLPRRTGPALPAGRGYYVQGGKTELVQVAMLDG
jgi:S-DNA-T family DNA segregation ATPase FtsK/SpoIIIE